MGEVFQVVFNSIVGPNIISNANLLSVSYNVNWIAFLPQKYKKFSCKFTFKSAPYGGLLLAMGVVGMNFGRMNTFDGLQQIQTVGVIMPNILSTTQTNAAAAQLGPPAVAAVIAVPLLSRYEATANDNNEFWIDYPTNTILTVSIKAQANGTVPSFQPYVLILTLTGIDDI